VALVKEALEVRLATAGVAGVPVPEAPADRSVLPALALEARVAPAAQEAEGEPVVKEARADVSAAQIRPVLAVRPALAAALPAALAVSGATRTLGPRPADAALAQRA